MSQIQTKASPQSISTVATFLRKSSLGIIARKSLIRDNRPTRKHVQRSRDRPSKARLLGSWTPLPSFFYLLQQCFFEEHINITHSFSQENMEKRRDISYLIRKANIFYFPTSLARRSFEDGMSRIECGAQTWKMSLETDWKRS